MKDRTTQFDKSLGRLLERATQTRKIMQVLNRARNLLPTSDAMAIDVAIKQASDIEDAAMEVIADIPMEVVRAEFRSFSAADWSAYQGCETMNPGIFEHTCASVPIEVTVVKDGQDYCLELAMWTPGKEGTHVRAVLQWRHENND